MEGGGRKHCSVNFGSLGGRGCFNHWWMRGGGWHRKSYLGPTETAPFSSQNFIWSNKHETFWHVALTGYFFVLISWTIAVTDFCPLEIYENLGLPLSTVTFTVNSHADSYFYKYVCFKCYTVWNKFFIKIHIKVLTKVFYI